MSLGKKNELDLDMKLEKFTIIETSTLREALESIDANKYGLIFVTSSQGSVFGVLTDGDIRRYLIEGGNLNDQITKCANVDFIWEHSNTPREILLKKLNSEIRFIPLLDDSRHLVGLVSRDHLPINDENAVYARARAPVRLSFSGGGSDITQYFSDNGGAVINATISLYSHATLRIRNDQKVILHSLDIGEIEEANDLKSAIETKSKFGLIKSLLRIINPDFGFELFIHSDYPMKSGLGGSAAILAAILGCFNQFRFDQWDLYELSEIAFQAERFYLGILGGWQDQYATVFGGFNFMEFRMEQNLVHPLRVANDTLNELEESLLLCDTNIIHESHQIHEDQSQEMKSDTVKHLVRRNVQLSYDMRNHLLRGKLLDFGKALDEAWQLKRKFSSKISSPKLDQIYSDAKTNGAIGGKLLGAGGGGFFLFYVPPDRKINLMKHIEASDLRIQPFRFDANGLQAWKMRENNSI